MSSSANSISFCKIFTGSAIAITVTAPGTIIINDTELLTTNTEISGTGILYYSNITNSQVGSSNFTTTVSTVIPLTTVIGTLNLNAATFPQGSIPYAQTTGVIGAIIPAQNGDILQLNGGIPTWSTPSFPITIGNTGSIIRSNGTDWAASTATYPNTTTANQLLYSSATNTIPGLATANTAVLATNGSGVPSLTATPTVTSITFGAGTALNSYVEGTFTPTLVGESTAGTTTYTGQQGYYTRIGNIVCVVLTITGSGATGTGNVNIASLPFTIKNQTLGNTMGSISIGLAQTFPVGTTGAILSGQFNQTFGRIGTYGTAVAGAALQMANVAFSYTVQINYQI